MKNTTTLRVCIITGMLLAQACLPITTLAQDALQRIPENALGFAVVRNLAEASTKFEQLLEPFEMTLPGPLTFAKLVTGLDTGLDESGDLVIALLPGEGREVTTQPVVLLPVADYESFATSINADTSGEVCRITLLGEDILVAQLGKHAILMNVEHRATMEKLLLHTQMPMEALSQMKDWLPKQNVALVLMPKGFRHLSNQQRQSARRRKIGFDFTEEPSMLSQWFSAVSGAEIADWLSSNAEIAAVGISVDNHSNVRLSEQLIIKKSSPLASLVPGTFQKQTAKLALSNKPYTFTAGGPVAPGWGKQLATFLRQLEQKSAAENGLENIASGLWDKEDRAYQLLLEEIQSCSVVMLTGEKGEPLVGNFLGVATVPDVSKYFDSLPEVIETWNEITQQSTSDVKPEFKMTTETIAGKQRCEIVVDIATTARDPNVPVINWMLEAAFGPDGKLRVQLAQVNPTTFVFGLATQEQISELLTVEQKNETFAPQNTEMQATLKLLKPATPWKALISPQGCLRWASRAYSEFFALINDDEIMIPVMPDSPPIGMTVEWKQRRWECEIVCPANTWGILAKYIEAAKDL